MSCDQLGALSAMRKDLELPKELTPQAFYECV
jgi:hypothetical protein